MFKWNKAVGQVSVCVSETHQTPTLFSKSQPAEATSKPPASKAALDSLEMQGSLCLELPGPLLQHCLNKSLQPITFRITNKCRRAHSMEKAGED